LKSQGSNSRGKSNSIKLNLLNYTPNPGPENPKNELKSHSATAKQPETVYTLKMTNYARGQSAESLTSYGNIKKVVEPSN